MSYFRTLILATSLALTLGPVSAATVVTTLHSCLPTGTGPQSQPIVGSDGTLYGVTPGEGPYGSGTIYSISPGGVFKLLHSFSATDFTTGDNTDGGYPYCILTFSSDGQNLYGTTSFGGTSGNGTIFKMSINGTGFTTLHSLTLSEGTSLQSALTLSPSGTILYGTINGGGANNYGAIFKINTDGTGFTDIHDFTLSTDGGSPNNGVTLNSSGTMLYGTTEQGGSNGDGTVFKMGTDGTGFTVLHTFSTPNGNGDNSDGANPYCIPVLSSDGLTLYGTANGAGANGSGTIWKIGTGGTGFTTLRSFTNATDGSSPYGSLLLSGSTLYGTTVGGGLNGAGAGTVWSISTSGSSFSVLHALTSTTDGANPYCGVSLSGTTLYGATAAAGGGLSAGSLFKVSTTGTNFTVVKNFYDDMAFPQAPLLPLSQGGVTTLFGVGLRGGVGTGMLVGMNTSGSLSLADTNISGSFLCGGLTSDGNPTSTATLYGVSEYDPSDAAGGTLFSSSTAGVSGSTLNQTPGTTGAYSIAGLTRIGTNYYGVAMGGGTNSKGTIFQANYAGFTVSALHTFNTTDGAYPCGTLVANAGGTVLYGTTLQGGTHAKGTVFSYVISSNTLTTLYSFNTTDGAYPECGLALVGTTLYGTTTSGGIHGVGTLFKVSTTGTGFTDLHDFNTTDGRSPIAGPTAGSNGTLYGTTVYGGVHGVGSLYSFNPTGSVFTSLYSFSGLDGSVAVSPLVEDPNLHGTFYGTTQYGGSANLGAVYSLIP